jgi:hypothetical protein
MPVKPIFIMGAPRSGTTLLASILASRDDIITLPEMHYMHPLLREEFIYGKLDKDHIITTLKENYLFNVLGIAYTDIEMKKLVSDDVKTTINNIIERYNEVYYPKNYRYWVEHSGFNHQYFNILRHYYPSARFIHIVRDGRAVLSSTIETRWGYKDSIIGAVSWKRVVEDCLILSKIFP